MERFKSQCGKCLSECHNYGNLPPCTGLSGYKAIAVVRRLAPSRKIERKLLYENAKKMFKL